MLVCAAKQLGVELLHKTLVPVQHVAPSPEVLSLIMFSPGRHFPAQNGAVPRHVSALAGLPTIQIATIAASFMAMKIAECPLFIEISLDYVQQVTIGAQK